MPNVQPHQGLPDLFSSRMRPGELLNRRGSELLRAAVRARQKRQRGAKLKSKRHAEALKHSHYTQWSQYRQLPYLTPQIHQGRSIHHLLLL